MIERPKRSVTRFFVPLIDVLILLFCIFLLMPFVASSPKNRSISARLSVSGGNSLSTLASSPRPVMILR